MEEERVMRVEEETTDAISELGCSAKSEARTC